MEVDVRWQHPGTSFIVGASGTGKTHILNSILENKDNLFKSETEKKISNIVLCYGAWQDYYDQWVGKQLITKSIEGFPSMEKLQPIFSANKTKGGTILILDDLVPLMTKSDIEALHLMLTVSSHHNNVSIIFVGHNLFHRGMRECSLQYHRYILTNNFRDSSQVALLGRQIFPANPRFIAQVYKDVLKTKYNNLILDVSPNQSEDLRVTGKWFKESPIEIYKQK